MLETKRNTLSFTRLAQIEARRSDPVIEGILYANTIACMVGKPGTCKSFVAQAMAASIASGTNWMGRRVKQGAVFYIAGEGLNGIRKRFDGWSEFTGVSLIELPIYISNEMPLLCEESSLEHLIGVIETITEDLFFKANCVEPVLVVIDTFARALAGRDENSAADVGRLINALDALKQRFKCCVLTIHHTGHANGAKERGRGSSAWYGALDTEMLATNRDKLVIIRSTKAKDYEPHEELRLEREIVEVKVGGVVETTLVLKEARSSNGCPLSIRQEKIRPLLRKGMSLREIMRELDLTKAKVEYAVRKIRAQD